MKKKKILSILDISISYFIDMKIICLNNTLKTSSTLCNKLPAFNNNLILQVLNLPDKRLKGMAN